MAELGRIVREISEILDEHYAIPADLVCWYRFIHSFEEAGHSGRDWTTKDINRGLSELGLSHTVRLTREEIDFYHLLDAYRELRSFRLASGQYWKGGVVYTGIGITTGIDRLRRDFITGILPGSPAAKAGLLIGDELIAVNGCSFHPVLAFEGLAGRPVSLRLRRERCGSTTDRQVVPARCRPGQMLARATRLSARKMTLDNRRVGYIKAWSLAGDAAWLSLTRALSKNLGDCEALVLDLRGGVGGASPEAADHFLGRSPELRLRSPRCKHEIVVNERWRKPVVVVADGSTRSGSEVLAFALKNAGIPVVGERTAGEVSAGKPFLLSDQSLLLVATKVVTVEGVVLEGKGVEPTVHVAREIPYSGGDDPPLREASRIASSVSNPATYR